MKHIARSLGVIAMFAGIAQGQNLAGAPSEFDDALRRWSYVENLAPSNPSKLTVKTALQGVSQPVRTEGGLFTGQVAEFSLEVAGGHSPGRYFLLVSPEVRNMPVAVRIGGGPFTQLILGSPMPQFAMGLHQGNGDIVTKNIHIPADRSLIGQTWYSQAIVEDLWYSDLSTGCGGKIGDGLVIPVQ